MRIEVYISEIDARTGYEKFKFKSIKALKEYLEEFPFEAYETMTIQLHHDEGTK